LKILHINTFEFGGAATAAIRLHNSLLQNGIDSRILFLSKPKKSIKNSYGFIEKENKIEKFKEQEDLARLKKLKKEYNIDGDVDTEIISFPRTSLENLTDFPIVKDADIIHLHWVAKFIDFETFFKKIQKPIVWTFHDSYPFEGLFHYIGDINLNPWIRELNVWAEKIKFESFLHANIHVVTPSEWMKQKFLKKRFNYTSLHVIRNSYESKRHGDFNTNNKTRKGLNETIFLFNSWILTTRCKRFEFFLKLASEIASNNVRFICVGQKNGYNIPRSIEWLGFYENQSQLAEIYSSVDATIVCSENDNSPNVILESLSFGTPVIGVPSGGIKELIDHQNGICSDFDSYASLLKSVKKFLKIKKSFCRKNIIINAENKFSPNIQSKKYTGLYKRISQ
jgi:glycosyltransferase involved in cell wall biosynthesis